MVNIEKRRGAILREMARVRARAERAKTQLAELQVRLAGIGSKRTIVDEILAARRSGQSAVAISKTVLLSQRTIRKIINDSGEAFPPTTYSTIRKSDRNLAIVQMYKNGSKLREVGVSFGVSAERVRQILIRFEMHTGETVARHPKAGPPAVLRVRWTCAQCNKERIVTEARRAKMRDLCLDCQNRSRARMDDDFLDHVIAMRSANLRWFDICAILGEKYTQPLQVAVWRYLQRCGEDPRVAFADVKTGWLEHQFPLSVGANTNAHRH